MEYGKGIKVERAEAVLAKVGGLLPAEVPLMYFKVNNFRPSVDLVIITNMRLIAVATIGSVVGFECPLALIADTAYDAKKSRIRVVTADGRDETLKVLAALDVPIAQGVIELARQHAPSVAQMEELAPVAQRAGSAEVRTAARAEKADARQRASDAKSDEKAEAKRLRNEKITADRTAAGRVLAAETFSGYRIEICENGYVRVAPLLMTAGTQYERLMGIDASADVSKKSAFGRGLGVVATAGLSSLSSNKRGDVYLTIVTDVKVHKMHVDPPTAGSLKASKSLASAGKTVLEMVARHDAAKTQPSAVRAAVAAPAPQSVSDRLRELTSMRDDGLVSLDEYEAMRQKVLDTL